MDWFKNSRIGKVQPLIVVMALLIIGWLALSQAGASTFAVNQEMESGSLAGSAQILTESGASGNAVVRFASGNDTFYGINWHPMWINAGGQDGEMDLMRQAGIGSVRIDAEWYDLEQSRGSYQPTYMARLDHAIDGLLARGIEPLVVVTSTPQWVSGAPANDPDSAHEPPLRSTVDQSCSSSTTICTTYDHTSDYANFLEYLIRHWSGKVHTYEIWNEPDGNWAWRRTETDWIQSATNAGKDYAKLLHIAYQRAKTVDPSLTIAGGSLSSTDDSTQYFLKSMYDIGAAANFDVLSQHYYCDPPNHNWCNSNRSVYDPVTSADTFTNNIVPIMRAYNDAAKPVWVTETGYNSGPSGVSEQVQANYTTAGYTKARTLPGVQRLYTYEMDGTDTGTNPEDYYGLINADMYNANSLPAGYRLKPAYNSLRALTGH